MKVMSIKSISGKEMKIIDTNCSYRGISKLLLMENAGAAIAKEAFSFFKCFSASENSTAGDFGYFNVVFFAGKGNNGGDAFVAARHLSGFNNFNSYKIKINVVCLYSESEIKTEESRINFNILKNIPGVCIIFLDQDSGDLFSVKNLLKKANLIIDSISGTGFSGNVRFKENKTISLINDFSSEYKIPVLSVDIPSGLNPDSYINQHSIDESSVIKASKTVTFHKMKTFLKNPEKFVGDVCVYPIGIPSSIENYVGPGHFLNLIKKSKQSHKGDSGKVLVVGGGPYIGAPLFSGLSALRAGSDIVTVAVPSSAFASVSSYSPHLIVKKLPSNSEYLCSDDITFLKELVKTHDSVVIGPGLGNNPETLDAVFSILSFCNRAVIDADAIYPKLSELDFTDKQFVFTPHKGEFKRLFPEFSVPEISDLNFNVSDLFSDLKNASKKYGNSTFILKGPTDIIFNSNNIVLNDSGNSEMTVGGTGDVLAGIVGSFLAKNSSFDSASSGAFLAGISGDIALESAGPGLTAYDIVSNISNARLKINKFID